MQNSPAVDQHTYPCFVPGVRLRWDDVRKRHLLLFPEGVLTLNWAAVAVLELCDGKRTLGAIAAQLESRYQGASVINDVLHLLSRLAKRGLLLFETANRCAAESKSTFLSSQRTSQNPSGKVGRNPNPSGSQSPTEGNLPSGLSHRHRYASCYNEGNPRSAMAPLSAQAKMDRPFTLIAELTYRCPLRCPYCSNPLDCGNSNYRQELATEDWLRVIQQAEALGVMQLGFTGGEPLLRQDLEVLVAAATGAGLYTTLVTAGTLFTPERGRQLRDAGLDHVQISIQDSRTQESDAIAGTPSFEKKIEAARLAKALGFPLTLNFVLHRHNIDRIEEIIELCEVLQADRVELANTQYYGWALSNRSALLPTSQQLYQAERVVAAAKERRSIPMGIVYVIPDYYEEYPKPCLGGWGRQVIAIAPNGDVLPCQVASSIPEMEFANLRDYSLEWIWFESEAFNRFRGTNWMSQPCQSCPRRELDFGGCRCQAFLLAKDATATDPVCHLSPHHHLVVAARERVQSEQPLPLIYRSM